MLYLLLFNIIVLTFTPKLESKATSSKVSPEWPAKKLES